MIFELENPTEEQINKLCAMTSGVRHELTVECVIRGTSPGEIYVDDLSPQSCFIKTPECNALAGENVDEAFLSELSPLIDYY